MLLGTSQLLLMGLVTSYKMIILTLIANNVVRTTVLVALCSLGIWFLGWLNHYALIRLSAIYTFCGIGEDFRLPVDFRFTRPLGVSLVVPHRSRFKWEGKAGLRILPFFPQTRPFSFHPVISNVIENVKRLKKSSADEATDVTAMKNSSVFINVQSHICPRLSFSIAFQLTNYPRLLKENTNTHFF